MMILMLSGFIIVSGGVTARYVGKFFDKVKGRPLFVIDSRAETGIESGESHPLAPTDQTEMPAGLGVSVGELRAAEEAH